jgi:hypothetical protein
LQPPTRRGPSIGVSLCKDPAGDSGPPLPRIGRLNEW